MQKVGVGHETACGGTWYSMDHAAPSQTRMSLSSSGETQKCAEAQATPMMPSLGSGQRICGLADHEVPSQASALPSGDPARQKVAVGHETCLKLAGAKSCGEGADHEVP